MCSEIEFAGFDVSSRLSSSVIGFVPRQNAYIRGFFWKRRGTNVIFVQQAGGEGNFRYLVSARYLQVVCEACAERDRSVTFKMQPSLLWRTGCLLGARSHRLPHVTVRDS